MDSPIPVVRVAIVGFVLQFTGSANVGHDYKILKEKREAELHDIFTRSVFPFVTPYRHPWLVAVQFFHFVRKSRTLLLPLMINESCRQVVAGSLLGSLLQLFFHSSSSLYNS